jgi:hemerythrin-like domain-containing protein
MSATSITRFASPVSAVEFSVHVKDPIEHLQHCHQRIERSLVTVQNAVAALRLTEPVLRAEAAAALDYELALLELLTDLHTQDEERSLFPRLRKSMPADDPDFLLDVMLALESQHHEQQAIFRDLAVCLYALSNAGAESEDELRRLESLVGQLDNALRPHMALEDKRLLPACRRYLAQPDLDAMRREMWMRFNGSKPN